MDQALMFARLLVWIVRSYFEPVLGVVVGGLAYLDILTLVPTVGTLSLLLGLGLAIRRPARALWLQAVPFLLGTLFSAGSVVWFAAAASDDTARAIVPAFLAAEVLLAAALVVLTPASRWAAGAFGAFSISYALYAAFIAGMALTGDWL